MQKAIKLLEKHHYTLEINQINTWKKEKRCLH